MRFKGLLRQQVVIGISTILLLSTLSSAVSVRASKKSSSISETAPNSEKQVDRQGLYSEDDDQLGIDGGTLDSKELVKKSQNVTEAKTAVKRKTEKEHSPVALDALPPSELGVEENSEEEGVERLAKSDLNRESRGDKSQRIYYDDTAPRFRPSHPHNAPDADLNPFERSEPETRTSKNGKLYFPKNYMSSKFPPGPKKNSKPSLLGLSGKRIPDHVQFDEGSHPAHEYTSEHQGHPGFGHHEQQEEHETGPVDDVPFHGISHGIEEHNAKGHHPSHHVSGYGYHHHYGSYRHTIGDKVDAVGKALQVLIPSALLITGVSALFPNRVHVPTTPNKYRQKRSVHPAFRRISQRGMMPPLPLPLPSSMPSSHLPPELEDIPTHILHAEHRIMDGNPAELYPDYGKRYGSPTTSAESTGFNPFRVFKGPGPENEMAKIESAMRLPAFPNLPPEMSKTNVYLEMPGLDIENGPPPTSLTPVALIADVPPTVSATPIISEPSPPTSNLDDFMKERQNRPMRRRKPMRKQAQFLKETLNKPPIQFSSESQSQYLVKNTLDDTTKQLVQVKAEREFMSSLKNLVTPDVAKAIVENKQTTTTPRDVDLSPDSPVMGLLTSYAQHEKETPACQKRALCELAVKGKSPKSTKFEAFLWSVATLVPDVFSEMYDLQEVFQAIRDERCNRFNCSNPNLDIQA